MESALTNSADINANTVRLWNGRRRGTRRCATYWLRRWPSWTPQRIQLVIQDEVDTILQYQNVVNGQVPNQAALLEYLKQVGGTGCMVNTATCQK